MSLKLIQKPGRDAIARDASDTCDGFNNAAIARTAAMARIRDKASKARRAGDTDSEISSWEESLKLDLSERSKAEVLARLAELKSARMPDKFVSKTTGMEFVLVRPGTFRIGSPVTEAGRHPDEDGTEITLSKAYYIGKYEVTQSQWVAVMGNANNPSFQFNSGPVARQPVNKVKYEQAVEFANKLGRLDGVSCRLPTETEWEYACRADTKTPWAFPNFSKALACFAAKAPREVGSYKPNSWGIYDMHGNVAEWVADIYNDYPKQSTTDWLGTGGDPDMPDGVLRGGSFQSATAEETRSSARLKSGQFRSEEWIGVRVVIDGESIARTIRTAADGKPPNQ